LIVFREKSQKRETRLIPILQFITNSVWKSLFGRAADAIEKVTGKEDECNNCFDY
jgi:hypothetical protein